MGDGAALLAGIASLGDRGGGVEHAVGVTAEQL